MPSDGQTFASVQMGDPFRAAGIPGAGGGNPGDGLIPAGAPLGRQTVSASVARKPTAPVVAKPVPSTLATAKAEPGFTAAAPISASGPLTTRIGTRIAAVDRSKLPPEARGERTGVTLVTNMTSLPAPDAVRPPMIAAATPSPKPMIASPATLLPATNEKLPVQIAPSISAPVVEKPEPGMTILSPLPPAPKMEADAGVALPSPGLVGPPVDAQTPSSAPFEVAAPKPESAPPPAKPVAAAAPVSRLASILSGIEPEVESAPVALPTAAEIKATQRAVARKTAAAAEAAAAAQLAKDEKAKAAAAAKANPARLWVQVATGNNPRGLGTTWRKIREANATLLKPYGGYSLAYKATNRVLAGPVKSSSDARALVNALGKAGVSATTYSSEAGQEVVKLAGK
jgi:SPOR domain